jgi:hypothetical protein
MEYTIKLWTVDYNNYITEEDEEFWDRFDEDE